MRILIFLLLLAVSLPMYSQSDTDSQMTFGIEGIELFETLNDDGSAYIRKPYKWYAGFGESDVKSNAVEMAQQDAYSRILHAIDKAVEERNGQATQVVRSYWTDASRSVLHDWELMDTQFTYNNETGMYKVKVKIGIRGDKFLELLKSASNAEPEGLDGGEQKQFIDAGNN